MSIKNGFLYSRTGRVDLSKSIKAELHIEKKNDVIVQASVIVETIGSPISYRDEIEISDLEILEDYFITDGTEYSTITHRN